MKYIIAFILVPFYVFAGNDDVGKLLSLLPNDQVGTPIYFSNPMEPQIYLGHNNIQPNSYMPFQGMVPFGIGGKKQLYKKLNYEIGFSTVVHGQLGYREENNASLKGTRVSLLNADFLLNFYYTQRIKKHWKMISKKLYSMISGSYSINCLLLRTCR